MANAEVDGGKGGAETGEEAKKQQLIKEITMLVSKRSGTDAPRYAAMLKAHVALQNKRRRAAAVRRRMFGFRSGKISPVKKASKEQIEHERGKKRRDEKYSDSYNAGPGSRSPSREPVDCGCGRQMRKRRRRRRPRRRSCRRRTVRRRSRRRRRRSRSRRRRRRSCRRRRRTCRRRR